jgi:hypothetical protein
VCRRDPRKEKEEAGLMDQELIAYLDERFRETSQVLQHAIQHAVQGLRKEMDERFKEVNDTTRQTLVIVEDLRDEIHLVAEAFLGTDERVKRLEDAESLTFEVPAPFCVT